MSKTNQHERCLNEFRVTTTEKGYQYCHWCGTALCPAEIKERVCYDCVIAGNMSLSKQFWENNKREGVTN